jgi:hypothetical protein
VTRDASVVRGLTFCREVCHLTEANGTLRSFLRSPSANATYKAVVAAASCVCRAGGSGGLLVGCFVETQMVSDE